MPHADALKRSRSRSPKAPTEVIATEKVGVQELFEELRVLGSEVAANAEAAKNKTVTILFKVLKLRELAQASEVSRDRLRQLVAAELGKKVGEVRSDRDGLVDPLPLAQSVYPAGFRRGPNRSLPSRAANAARLVLAHPDEFSAADPDAFVDQVNNAGGVAHLAARWSKEHPTKKRQRDVEKDREKLEAIVESSEPITEFNSEEPDGFALALSVIEHGTQSVYHVGLARDPRTILRAWRQVAVEDADDPALQDESAEELVADEPEEPSSPDAEDTDAKFHRLLRDVARSNDPNRFATPAKHPRHAGIHGEELVKAVHADADRLAPASTQNETAG